MFHELISDEEKIEVLQLLVLKKREQWRCKYLRDYWYTSRMLQGLTHTIVTKRIFVQNRQDIRVILCSFIRSRTLNYEVWIDRYLHIDELKSISRSLLEMANEVICQGKICVFAIVPSNLGKLMTAGSHGPNLSLAMEGTLYNYYLSNTKRNKAIFDGAILDGFEIKPIPEDKIKRVMATWRSGSDIDICWLKHSINGELAQSVWDSRNDTMIGQFIYMPIGTFGALFIDPRYKWMKLEKMLIGKFMELLRSKEMDMLITIEIHNTDTIGLLERLHFKRISESAMLVFIKVGEIPALGHDF